MNVFADGQKGRMNTMKKKRAILFMTAVLAAGALALGGCGGDAGASGNADAAGSGAASGTEDSDAQDAASEAETDLLAQIQEKGEIVVAMEGTWAPWTYHDEQDELVGYDVEVAQHIAEKLGVTATFVECEWDGIFAGIDAKRYDIAVNGVEITDERAEKYDFSDPYAYIRTAIIVKGDNDEIKSFEDLDGKSTANTLTSTYAELAESYGAIATGVDDLNQTFELLLAGRVDATLNAEVSFYDYMNAHPEADVKITALTEDASFVAIPMRKGPGTETLRAAVNQAIAELSEEGILTELSNKYFGADISKDK